MQCWHDCMLAEPARARQACSTGIRWRRTAAGPDRWLGWSRRRV
ncbi:hypothetical protein KCH_56100 [Kitasatospora cheerisanensis KCTC 2395]|uniref:Uncharacterized protein n=1 Tax=Kitasatospora cheerisanensis KCTC 2395 TaxID=1348663 RepID=A0A066YXS4_9ACTN|nr:hypothetical protein KCH_56100 [Kitasatospora cheerisanensis KCTC 2395]